MMLRPTDLIVTGALGLALLGVAAPARAELAWVANRDGVWVVHRQADLDSRPVAVRPDLAYDASAPALSPDGTRIAFEVAGRGILVCPRGETGRCTEIETELGSPVRPAWEPRSGELVVVRYTADARGEDSDLLITRDGLESVGPLISQTGNQDDPDLSPDGRRLAYSSAQTVSLHRAGVAVVRQLWLMDLASGRARPLVPGAHQDIHPDFSPSGSLIAFSSDRSGQYEIWVVNAVGGGLRQVTSGPGAKTWPAWSPNGDSILFTRSHEGRDGLWLVPAAGGEARPLEPFGAGAEVSIRDPDWR